MRTSIFFVIILIFSCFGWSQDFTFEGQLKDFDTGKKLGGVKVTAYVKGSEVFSTTAAANGKYSVNLPINQSYEIKYSLSGYVNKMMKIDANGINEEDLPSGGRIFPPIDIELFADRPNANFSFLNKEPVVIWTYHPTKLVMDWDRNVYEKMKDKIETTLAKADKDAKEGDAQFNKLIQEGDAAFNKQDYEGALKKYEAAISIKGKEMETHPNTRILEIEDILQAKRKEALLNQQADEKYNNLIAAAENFKKNKDYEKAIDKFYEAADEKPGENYPLDQIDEIRKIVKEQKKKKEYDELIEMADRFYDQNSLQAARDKYQRALFLYPDEQHPKKRLEEMDNKLKAEEEAKEKKRKYDEAIAAADAFFDQENFEEAIAKYQEAITFESAATYPKERKKLAQEKIAALEAAKKVEEEYQAAIKSADELKSKEDWNNALTSYQKASKIKPDENYPKEQIKSVQDKLKEMEAELAQKEKIESLLAAGKNAEEQKKWQEALAKYQEVLGLSSSNKEATEGKDRAVAAIEKEKAYAEQMTAFNNLVKQADASFKEKNWKEAITKYEEANNLIPDDNHVTQRIKDAQEQLEKQQKEQELLANISNLYTQAAKKEADENWSGALKDYQSIIALKSDEQKAIDAKKRIEEQLGTEKTWQEKVALGDQLFKEEKWQAAKAAYEEAQKIKEDNNIALKIQKIEEKVKLLADQEAQEAIQKAYQEAIKLADAAFDNQNWSDAPSKYEEALKIKAEDAYATSRIAEIQKLEQEALAAQDQSKQIETLLAKGTTALGNRAYDKAIQAFEDVLTIDAQNKPAAEKLNEATTKKAELDTFNKWKNEGDVAFANSEWENAINSYNAALKVMASPEVEQKLKEIEGKQKALQASQNQAAAFSELIDQAKAMRSDENFSGALEKTNAALAIQPGNEEAKTLKKELEFELEILVKEKAAREKFANAMQLGKDLLAKEEYKDAVDAFDEALKYIMNDKDAIDLRQEAYQKYEANKEREAQFEATMKNAKLKKIAEEFDEALALFEKAKKIKPNDAKPQKEIDEINALIADKEKSEEEKRLQQEIRKKYKDLIQAADALADRFELEEALKTYKEASDVLPEEKYPKGRMKALQDELDKRQKEQNLEQNYEKAIAKADAAMEQENWMLAKSEYESALKLKPEETYPQNQIEKLKDKLAEFEQKEKDQKFLTLVKSGKTKLDEENYADALSDFEAAIVIKPTDEYANQKVDEIKSIINDLALQQKSQQEQQAQFDKILAAADELFNAENYLNARDKYEEALKVIPNNAYALRKRDESVERAEELERSADDERYKKIVDKADEYFEEESYDEALGLYQRALGLRAADPYPKMRIERIEQILNPAMVQNVTLEDLGERIDGSIIDGAALLQQADRDRQAMQKADILSRVTSNEENFERLNLSDNEQRLASQSEVERIKNLRTNADFENTVTQQQTAIAVSTDLFRIADQKLQENTFENAELLRANEQIVYMLDDYEQLNRAASTKHLANADRVDDLQLKANQISREQGEIARDVTLNNANQIVVTVDQLNNDAERAVVMRKQNETVIDDINNFYISETFNATEDNYRKIQGLSQDVQDAALQELISNQEKSLTHNEIQSRIMNVKEKLTDQQIRENQELITASLEIDQIVNEAQLQYLSTLEGKDEGRWQNVDAVDGMFIADANNKSDLLNRKTENIRGNMQHFEDVRAGIEQGNMGMEDDLLALRLELDRQEDDIARRARLISESNAEKLLINKTKVADAEDALKATGSSRAVIAGENHQVIDKQGGDLDAKSRDKGLAHQTQSQKTQVLLADLMTNKVAFTEAVANTLGAEFPEGVSQENFVKRDAKGLPLQITTRRIVVQNGRGDVYLRIQNRNLITYSKNGRPITETAWIKETENAKLQKHY
ncbi:MAG: hypothetical protein JJT77_00805 [Crocinitomicaceae bacterium]|nr:hypothetical protein [Crocinitomicaceae bacterium]